MKRKTIARAALAASIVLALGVGMNALPGAVAAQPPAVDAKLQSANVLLVALKRQNAEKQGGKGAEIDGIEADLRRATELQAGGQGVEAQKLIDAAYVRTKTAIASMQQSTGLKSGSAALAEALRIKLSETDSPQLRVVYARRESSLKALLSAGERVAKERGSRPNELAQAEQALNDATVHVKNARYPEGIAAVERGYLQAKAAVSTLRGGQQLMADKNFSTPAEEFDYEQRRNDDYRKLIDLLTKGVGDAALTTQVESSRQAREAADRAAGSGDWTQALKRIDASTLELKQILKLAGFPIM